MKHKKTHMRLFLIFSLLVTMIGLYHIGDADAYEQSGILEKTKDVFFYRGDITEAHNEESFGGDIVGKYFVMVNTDEVKVIAEFESSQKALAAWLVDMETDKKISIGHFDEKGKLYHQEILTPWIYDVIIITEVNDANQHIPVGGALLVKPQEHTSSKGF